MFKLTHLPWANIALFLGMGTEVLVFFISAFDRPFDKTADGREIPTHLTEEYLADGKVTYSNERAAGNVVSSSAAAAPVAASVKSPQGATAASDHQDATVKLAEHPQAAYVPQMSAEEAEKLNEAQGNYVTELQELVETLKRVNEQSSRLTRDSEEMENLNRTLTGISKVYEIQLKGASQQVGTIDQINEQTRKMAQQIDQLNKIYARMIEAMTVNMHVAAPGAAPLKEE